MCLDLVLERLHSCLFQIFIGDVVFAVVVWLVVVVCLSVCLSVCLFVGVVVLVFVCSLRGGGRE